MAVLKRCVDVAASGLGLMLVAPVLPLIAAAIYLDSPGPILYRQRRAGRSVETPGGVLRHSEFDMLKFRTMKPDSERTTGAVLAAEGDQRVTRVGRVLRKTRLDELPQLWNVLGGDMSLVGPRPERPEILGNLARIIPFFEERTRDVKPGVTGLAQISLSYTGHPPPGSPIERLSDPLGNPYHVPGAEGAVSDDMRLKLLYDLAYVAAMERLRTWLPLELKIILHTPLVMLRGLGR